MWPFKKKSREAQPKTANPVCPACGSSDTRLKVYFHGERPDYVKSWRGQRYITYHCESCQKDFYVEEPPLRLEIERQVDSLEIDDETSLENAEKELKRAADEEGDHRFG
jgi:hypothetical protein